MVLRETIFFKYCVFRQIILNNDILNIYDILLVFVGSKTIQI